MPSPHDLRRLNMLPMLQFLTAIGLVSSILYLKQTWRAVFTIVVIAIVLFSFYRYLFLYYVVTANKTSADWADGYKQLTSYVFSKEKSYDKVVISGHYWQPYIYVLFYKQYDPLLYQRFGSKKGFDKYVFGGTSWDYSGKELGNVNLKEFAGGEKILVALSPEEYAMQTHKPRKLQEIRNHNNELVFIVGEL